jgi:hypothetical protein
MSASVGIALYPPDAKELDELLAHADQAMYASKNAGRNRFSYFTPDLQEAALARQNIVGDLRQAIEAKDQFEICTSRSCRCRPGPCTRPRRCCAGAIPPAACWALPISFRSPSRTA